MLILVAAMIPRAARAFAVAVVFALSAACGAPSAPVSPDAIATAIPAEPASTASATNPPEAVKAEHEPAGDVIISRQVALHGMATPEEMTFLSDVVARVRFLSASAGVRRYPSADGRGADPVLAFRFRVIEYLKGSGDDELTVRVLARDYPLSDDIIVMPTPDANEALRTAQARLAERDTRWDGLEAIVFLRSSHVAEESGDYVFTSRYADATPRLSDYAITSDYENVNNPNRAWLPGGAPTGKAAADAAAASSSPEPR